MRSRYNFLITRLGGGAGQEHSKAGMRRLPFPESLVGAITYGTNRNIDVVAREGGDNLQSILESDITPEVAAHVRSEGLGNILRCKIEGDEAHGVYRRWEFQLM